MTLFSPDELKKKIEDTLNSGDVTIPDGHHIAFVTSFENGALHSAVASRIGDSNWKVSGEVSYVPTTKDWSTGVAVRWSK